MERSPLTARGVEAHRDEFRRESFTMALYVSICLLAALAVTDDDEGSVSGLVWGTTVGLALAHWFAFRVSARLGGKGTLGRGEAELAAAQLFGAAVVASVCTVPILLLSADRERDVARLALAVFLAVTGFVVARSTGADRFRAAVYALGVAALGLAVAIAKNLLAGH